MSHTDQDTATHQRRIKVRLYINHGKNVLQIAKRSGWRLGARYTNLRDTRHFGGPQFLDINWKNYCFERHLDAVRLTKPELTIAKDWEDDKELNSIIDQAYQLLEFSNSVAIVPKDINSSTSMEQRVPKDFIFGYSVPTRYGGTKIDPKYFKRKVHLLGGRPQTQLKLRSSLNVASLDQNSFTIDARFGHHFNGRNFVYSNLGYQKSIEMSLHHIKSAWHSSELNTGV